MGIKATLRRIRDTVFWPGINGEMRDLISRCEACQSYKPAQQKETLQAHERPTQPWAKAAADLFTEEGSHYLITVDYCTNFWEVDYLGTDTSSRAVINKLRAHFARHGIPRELITDNGPQFSSGEFSGFARSWNFAHVTTSPYYPQANGQAERAVKTAKGLMKKARAAGEDAWLAILEYRNTPSQTDRRSPAQRLFGHDTQSGVPTHGSRLSRQDTSGQDVSRTSTAAEDAYNQHAKDLPPLEVGDVVRIQPQQSGQPWIKALVENCSGPRSYDVMTENGTLRRRNRRHLRKTNEEFHPCNNPTVDTEFDDDDLGLSNESKDRDYNEGADERQSDEGQSDGEHRHRTVVTRSGRCVRPPQRYGDFVDH